MKKVRAVSKRAEDRKRHYRMIYELFDKKPRIYVKKISEKLGIDPSTAAKLVDEVSSLGIVTGPQVRLRSYQNTAEYVYFINSNRPTKLFNEYVENMDISYHTKMIGFCNLWINSITEIDVKGDTVLQGRRSDYFYSCARNRTWEDSFQFMQKKVEEFDAESYRPKGLIKTHFDETIEWTETCEKLYREFKYDLRKKLGPIMKTHHIGAEKIYEWLGKIPNHCSIVTGYFPEGISAYESLLYMVETAYEDFVIEVFSELPATTVFFKVNDTLFLYVHTPRQFMRSYDHQAFLKTIYLPLLMDELVEKGIIESETCATAQFSWGKSI